MWHDDNDDDNDSNDNNDNESHRIRIGNISLYFFQRPNHSDKYTKCFLPVSRDWFSIFFTRKAYNSINECNRRQYSNCILVLAFSIQRIN